MSKKVVLVAGILLAAGAAAAISAPSLIDDLADGVGHATQRISQAIGVSDEEAAPAREERRSRRAKQRRGDEERADEAQSAEHEDSGKPAREVRGKGQRGKERLARQDEEDGEWLRRGAKAREALGGAGSRRTGRRGPGGEAPGCAGRSGQTSGSRSAGSTRTATARSTCMSSCSPRPSGLPRAPGILQALRHRRRRQVREEFGRATRDDSPRWTRRCGDATQGGRSKAATWYRLTPDEGSVTATIQPNACSLMRGPWQRSGTGSTQVNTLARASALGRSAPLGALLDARDTAEQSPGGRNIYPCARLSCARRRERRRDTYLIISTLR